MTTPIHTSTSDLAIATVSEKLLPQGTKAMFDLETLKGTLLNLNLGNLNESFDNLESFRSNEVTRENVDKYINTLHDIVEQIDSMKIREKDKKNAKQVIATVLNISAESTCKSLIIEAIGKSNKGLKLKLNQRESLCKQLVDDYNIIAKKNNEKQKAISLPAVTISIVRNSKKPLDNDECMAVLKEVKEESLSDDNDYLCEKFKRRSVKSLEAPAASKIDSLHAKKSEKDMVTQRPSTPKSVLT